MPTTLTKRKKKPATSNGNGGNFTESAMDDYLAKKSLYRKPIAKDGSCLFRAVSEQIYNCQSKHLDVRKDCIKFMQKNREQFEEFVEGPFDHHLHKLQNPKEWAGQVEITAIAMMYNKDFVVYQDINSAPTKVTDYGFKDKILLCYSNGNHYDAIYPDRYKKNAAMCQSIVFEMLYNKVFSELDKREATRKGRQDVSQKGVSYDGQKSILDMVRNGDMVEEAEPQDSAEDEGWTQVKSRNRAKILARHAKPAVDSDDGKEKEEPRVRPNCDKYMWEIRRSVDSEFYRNVALEIWDEEKNERQQQDLTVAATLQYKNGDRCLAKVSPPNACADKYYVAIVKEDYTGSGSILIYVPELKERMTVPIQSLKPSDSQQDQAYKDLSGYYKKTEASNGSGVDESLKDDGKGRKKRPSRNRRGIGRGDEQGSFPDDVPRGRGRGRRGGRFPRGRDDIRQKDDEEARVLAEQQLQLVEIQEKDHKAFPALPVRSAPPVASPAVPTPQPVPVPEVPEIPAHSEAEKAPATEAGQEPSPAEFWSRLKNAKPPATPPSDIASPTTSKLPTPATSPTALKTANAQFSSDDSLSPKVGMSNENKEPLAAFAEVPTDVETKVVIENKKTEYIQSEKEDVLEPKGRKPVVDESKELEQCPTALKLKPVIGAKSNSSSAHVYEVKITEQAKILQPAKIVQSHKHSSQAEQSQINLPVPKPVVEKAVKPEPAERETTFNKTELVTEAGPSNTENDMKEIKDRVMNIIESEPDAISSVDENIKPALHRANSPENVRHSPITKEDFSNEVNSATEPQILGDELYTKRSKPKSVLVTESSISNNSPERKTVTFADETREIPAKPYYQQPKKGMLYLNGANNLNKGAVKTSSMVNEAEAEYLKKDNVFKPMYNIAAPSMQDDNVHASLQADISSKDQSILPANNLSEGVIPPASPTSQQQVAAWQSHAPFSPYPGGMIQASPSVDPTGADLPQDMHILRFFYNFGYQQYMYMMATGQIVNHPMVYMYPGSVQDQLMHQPGQPVSSMAQQMYPGMQQQQQMLYQQQGVQPYHQPYQLQQTAQDTPSQSDTRTNTDRNNQQPQQQATPQQQQAHQQHFQPQHQASMGQHQWRGARSHFANTSKHYYGGGHHGGSPQSPRPPFHQNPGSPRQPHFSQGNKPRRTQAKGHRNEQFTSHYSSTPTQGQVVNHTSATGPPHTTYYNVTGEQSKSPGEFYPSSAAVYNTTMNYQQHNVQAGMPQAPHTTGASRQPYN